MVLNGIVRETPNGLQPFLAVVTDQDGKVVATLPAATRQDADDSIDEAKFRLNKVAVEKRILHQRRK